MSATYLNRVSAQCDCGRTVSTWVDKSAEQLAGRSARVRCVGCGTIVHATGEPPAGGVA